ncbi:MAG: hypothetical protein HYZ45_04495, partial [Burkholderiales bacterium]|nr:hypothetical protein [Burkholderiales bacterium]
MNPAQHAQGRWALFGSSWTRALMAQFHPKILLLPLQPIVLSIFLWLGVLWLSFDRLSLAIQGWLTPYVQDANSAHWLAKLGSFLLQHALLPLLAGWALLPLMLLTSLIFIGVLAMPVVVNFVGQRDFPA